MEYMGIALQTMEVSRKSSDGLICKDNIRADISVAFFIKVNKTKDDVLRVAESIGCARASERASIEELFSAKFSEALKTVGKKFDFVELYTDRDKFRDEVIKAIGNDLNGYVLEDTAIDYLEQTPLEALDENNILDAEGIRKITELTALQKIRTNEFKREEELQIQKKDVETKEASLALERQQADAEAKQKREIDTIRARESAETEKVQAEEHLRAEQAKIASEQELEIQEENRKREVEVAVENRNRAVVIEKEKVKRAEQLEVVDREREVSLQKINAEKSIEVEKKEIADVIRSRIAVEKTVAEEEEKIKELREVCQADRDKQVKVKIAEADAEAALVREIQEAKAQEEAAKHNANQLMVTAQAELDASEKQAEAQIKLAEGTKAKAAAPGLAEAKVQEAKADAVEKTGLAEAKVSQEKYLADASGQEQIGMAEAKVSRQKYEADATGQEQIGMAEAKVKEANALIIAREGESEATAIRDKLLAEAEGLEAKFKAMDAISDKARDHEEFRMKLDKSHAQVMNSIDTNKDIAKEQAEVLAAAVREMDVDIVGGDGEFMEKFVKALSVGNAVDGAIEKSIHLRALVDKLMNIGNGDSSFSDIIDHAKEVVGERGDS